MSWRIAASITALFILSQILVTAVGVASMAVSPPLDNRPDFLRLLDGGPALDMWYRWDAGFYATIAIEGYSWVKGRHDVQDVAFLPLYPALIRAGMQVTGCPCSPYKSTCATVIGIILSKIALWGSLFLLFMLVAKQRTSRLAWRSIGLLCISPILVFLSGVYTESLFLFLVLGTFWTLDNGRYLFAVVLASFAVLTRTVGLALVPVLLWHAWQLSCAVRWRSLALAFVPAAVFGSYLLFVGVVLNDPLAFFHAYQAGWGRSTSGFIGAFTEYFRGNPVAFFGWSPSWLDFAMTILFLGLAARLFYQRRVAWAIFVVGALFFPINSGTLSAMTRYGWVLFPFYVQFAEWNKRSWQQAVLVAGFLGMMIFVTFRFVTWRWIA